MDIQYGFHAVQSLLDQSPERIQEIVVSSQRNDKRMHKLLTLANENRVKVKALDSTRYHQFLRQKELNDVSDQGVVAVVQSMAKKDEKDLDQLLEATDSPFLLILDGVTDPHNLGAVLRTAEAAGVHAVIAPKDKGASLTPTAIKVASGAAEVVPYIQVTNLARTMKDLQQLGIWIVGTAGETDTLVYDQDLKGNIAIVMGAEGDGMRRLTREHCDFLVKIPMVGTVSSLNVSVATGVILFEALRQRSGQ